MSYAIRRSKTYPHLTFDDLDLLFHCDGCGVSKPLDDPNKSDQREAATAFQMAHKDCKKNPSEG